MICTVQLQIDSASFSTIHRTACTADALAECTVSRANPYVIASHYSSGFFVSKAAKAYHRTLWISMCPYKNAKGGTRSSNNNSYYLQTLYASSCVRTEECSMLAMERLPLSQPFSSHFPLSSPPIEHPSTGLLPPSLCLPMHIPTSPRHHCSPSSLHPTAPSPYESGLMEAMTGASSGVFQSPSSVAAASLSTAARATVRRQLSSSTECDSAAGDLQQRSPHDTLLMSPPISAVPRLRSCSSESSTENQATLGKIITLHASFFLGGIR